jgi:uncharacterized protein YggT (Ycf19 family)
MWAVLFAAYAATLGVDARSGSRYTAGEAHRLLAAASIAEGDGLSLDRAYTARRWTEWQDAPLETDGEVVAGRLLEPYGVGFPLLIAPAFALGGATLVVLLLAAVAALAFVLAAALARRVAPDPWATWAALLAGLSPPALASATAVTPALLAGALLATASLCALAARERALMRTAFGGGAALAVLPWLDPWLLVPAAPVAVLLARWTARRGRAVIALGSIEIQLASLVFYVSLNDRLYGGFTPLAVADEPVTGAASVADYLDRLPRLAAVWVERDAGLLRWAPVLALAFLGVWLLWRSRRERLGRLVPEQRDAEHAAFLALTVCGAQVLVAVFALPALAPDALVVALPCAVPLMAWGLRHAPLAGWVLGALTLLGSVALVVDGAWADGSDAPWWPVVAAFPVEGSAWADALFVAGAVACCALLVAELMRRRRELRP